MKAPLLGPAWVVAWVFVMAISGCDGRAVAFLTPGISPGTPEAASKGRAGCIPNCRKKGCGTDGCGGHCGKCKKGRICLADQCVKNTTRELCHLVAGRWSGVMRAQPLHYLDGRIFRKGKVCRGRFRVSYNLGRKGRAWVVQEFVITFRGSYMQMRGVRLSSKSGNSNYNLDRFAGKLDKKLRRCKGRNRDVRGSGSYFQIDKK